MVRFSSSLLVLVASATLNVLGQDPVSPYVKMSVTACSFVDDDILVTAYASGELGFWNLKSRAPERRFPLAMTPVTSVSQGRRGELCATSGSELIVFDCLKQERIRVISLPCQIRRSLPSPDGEFIVSGCVDGRIRIHSRKTGEELQSMLPPFASPAPVPEDISISSDSGLFAVSYGNITRSPDKEVHVWNAKTFQRILDYGVDQGLVGSLAFHPKRPRLLAVPTGDSVVSLQLDKGDSPKRYAKLSAMPIGMRYSPDGTFLVVHCLDNSLVAISEKGRAVLLESPKDQIFGIDSIAFSPSGKLVAVRAFGDVRGVFIWQLPECRPWPR